MAEYNQYQDYGDGAEMPPEGNYSAFIHWNESAEWMAEMNKDHFGYVLYSIVVPVLFSIITLTGTIGNTLIIWIICTDLKMRTIINLLLLNLAVADLAFVLICPPFTAYQFATMSFPFSGILGHIMCKGMHYLLNVTAYVTIYTLVLIAVIRYFTIVHSVATVRFRTKKVVSMLIGAIWLVMLTVNIPILFAYGVQINPYTLSPDCESYGRPIGQKIYSTFFVFAYLLPLLIIAGLSIQILRYINGQRHSESFRRAQAAVDSANRTRMASRLLIVVIVVFAVFWFPIQIHLLVAHFGELPDSNLYRVMGVLFNFLAYFNSCVNPIIYNCTSQEFRNSFKRVLCCRNAPSVDVSRAEEMQLMSDTRHNGNGHVENMKLTEVKVDAEYGKGDSGYSNGNIKMVSVQVQCNGNSSMQGNATKL